MKSFSIIIPVLDETAEINRLIARLKALEGEKASEIIVVDGNPEENTLKMIENDHIRRLSSTPGRARQMNAGAAAATGDILIFLHADTWLPAKALQLIDGVMARPGPVGGAFDLGICSNRLIFRVIALTASLRSRLTRIPYGDQAIFIGRAYFHELGGYPDIPLMEDVAFMQKIKKAGDRIELIPSRVSTSPRRWEKEGVLKTTLRNWTLLSAYYLGVSPEKLARYYRSGKDLYAS
jgi:rSAM/selenodomain-associated transferase 2